MKKDIDQLMDQIRPVSPKGQVLLPKAVRDEASIPPNSFVLVHTLSKGTVLLELIPPKEVEELRRVFGNVFRSLLKKALGAERSSRPGRRRTAPGKRGSRGPS